MSNLSGKKALIIGGSRGIGASIVRRLRQDGASVLFTWSGSQQKAEELAQQTSTDTIRVDVSDRDALVKAIHDAGPIDILVFNAGVLVFGDPLTLNPDDIDHMINVNVRAAYFAAVEAARQMPDNGRIIVIGSTNADISPFLGIAPYSMTKSALQGMARGLSRDFGPRKITVNIIQPGPTNTDMNPEDGPMSDKMLSMMAIKQFEKPENIAAYVSFLTRPEASGITGSMQTIDGGFRA